MIIEIFIPLFVRIILGLVFYNTAEILFVICTLGKKRFIKITEFSTDNIYLSYLKISLKVLFGAFIWLIMARGLYELFNL